MLHGRFCILSPSLNTSFTSKGTVATVFYILDFKMGTRTEQKHSKEKTLILELSLKVVKLSF